MLAPVLARLVAVAGVVDARVDCTGTWFLLTGGAPGALEAAWGPILEILGPRAERAPPEEAAAQLEARPRGEPWFGLDGIRGLSYVEGRVLAGRMTDAVTDAVPLDAARRRLVGEAIRRELFAALDHAHDTGGRASSGWFWEAWPAIVDAIAGRLADLPEDLRAAIAARLRAVAGDDR